MVGGVDAKELRAPVFNIVHGSFVDGGEREPPFS